MPPRELPSDEQMKLQAQAYLAEYQAMMTRMNAFMAMQFAPLAPWIAFLAFVAAAPLHRVVVVWGTALVTQVGVFIYCFALYEVYAHARHIEIEIKPRIALLLNLETDSLWAWEKHLKQHGKAAPALLGDAMPTVFSAAAFIAGLIWMEWTWWPWWNWLGPFLSFVLMCANISQARRIIAVRRDLERATENSLQLSVKRLAREHSSASR